MKCTITSCKRNGDATKGTSSCVIKGYIDLSKHNIMFLNDDMFSIAKKHEGVTYDEDAQKLNIVVVGTTVIRNGDTYNELKGLRIAECHAKKHLFRTIRDINTSLITYMSRLITECEDEKKRYNKLAGREISHIAKLDANA